MLGEILGIAAPIIGGLLGGKSATGSSGTPMQQTPTYELGKNQYADALYGALMKSLATPVANVSYGGLSKPLYDTVKLNTMTNLLAKMLGVSSATGSQPAESGYLGDAALMMGLNPQTMQKLLGGLGGSSWQNSYAGDMQSERGYY